MLKKGERLIRNFDKNDSQQLVNIWQICFGDKREYIESFFERFGDSMKVGVYEEDGKIVSSLYCLEAELKFDGTSVKAWYLYAVATLPKFRKRGYASILINEVKNAADGRRVLFLTPSNEENRRFYEKLGFKDGCYSCVTEFKKTDKAANIELRERKDESLFSGRENVLREYPHVSWNEKHLDFAFNENTYLAFEGGREIGYFHYEKKDGKFVIDEICVEKDNVENVLNKACEIFCCEKLKTATQYGENCCKISKGMIYCKFDSIKKEIGENQFYLGANLE